ncbi:efflux transporter, outer membrane factor (OMF) lipoprotein, NodT family [Cupriavidus sp. YR651]|uniref:efflux transporter outer membrane subunit n=1 Tax=Cupriavidus sp. YR651 TaxID=1855315 RepID=UPI00087ECB9F|nr:TolC family protein [Cupriavidus sp. YR651]SDD50329.1 efflux transporter, outer membrane factor (OMF) lipoprotein, NodT family [Cupriavidus sp. YR651]
MKRLVRTTLAAMLPLALAACMTVGPDHKVPEDAAVKSSAANGPFQGTDSPAVSIGEVPNDWWRLYDDPRIDELVQQALVANTDLRVAAANLKRAIAVYHEVEAENLPETRFRASAERGQIAGEPLLKEEKIPVFNFGDVGFDVSYLIDFFGKLARADEAALAGTQASQAALDQARVGVVAETVRSYMQGCTATHELHVAQHQLDLQQRGVMLAQKLVDAGRGQPTDLLRAQAQADTLRATLPKYRAEQEVAAYRLAVMLGKPPTALDMRSVACEHVPALRQALPVGDGAALLKRRPDIRQAERELASATAKIGVATADLYPQIRIGASAGFTGILDHLGQAPTAHWGYGPMISWTLPTSGTRARIHNMEAGAEGALAQFDGVVLRALRETQSALSAYTHELDRNQALRDARDKADEAARQNRLLYQAGRSPYLNSLDADRTLAGSDAALAASDAQLAMNQINLFVALGGGWQDAPKVASHPVGEKHAGPAAGETH